MFFSVFNYFTKTKKRTLMEQRLTKDFVKKIKNGAIIPIALCNDMKNKSRRKAVGLRALCVSV